jgi:hypothetical protein
MVRSMSNRASIRRTVPAPAARSLPASCPEPCDARSRPDQPVNRLANIAGRMTILFLPSLISSSRAAIPQVQSLALGVEAHLIGFRRVDSLEADLRLANSDGVAIDDLRNSRQYAARVRSRLRPIDDATSAHSPTQNQELRTQVALNRNPVPWMDRHRRPTSDGYRVCFWT